MRTIPEECVQFAARASRVESLLIFITKNRETRIFLYTWMQNEAKIANSRTTAQNTLPVRNSSFACICKEKYGSINKAAMGNSLTARARTTLTLALDRGFRAALTFVVRNSPFGSLVSKYTIVAPRRVENYVFFTNACKTLVYAPFADSKNGIFLHQCAK